MRNFNPALYLFVCVVSYMFSGLPAVAQFNEPGTAENENRFVHPKDVILPLVKYDSNSSVRNPFRSGLPDKPAQEGVPPLERYELAKYRLTAVVNDLNGNYRGNLVDPNGMGHLAVVGTRVGTNGGLVTGVERNKLVVTEKYIDANGKEQVNVHEFVLGR